MQSPTAIRWLASLGLVGLATFAAAMIALHAIQPSLSPIHEAMSYYVHGPQGWLTTLGLIALGVGSLAITIAIARTAQGPRSRLGIVFLTLWSLGAILGGIFSADPPGHWNQPPSTSGAIHGLAAMIALASFPVASIALTHSVRRDNRWSGFNSILLVLAAAVVVSFIAFMASLLPVFLRPGPPVLLGLTERILFVAYIAWLVVVAVGLSRITGDNDRLN